MKRIWHRWTEWECFKAGFYASVAPVGMTSDSARLAYRDFLSDETRFNAGLSGVVSSWPTSCEHFLTNESLNRIAWLGQASMCFATGVPSCFRGGFNLLTPAMQRKANSIAATMLSNWIKGLHEKGRGVHRDMEAPGLFG